MNPPEFSPEERVRRKIRGMILPSDYLTSEIFFFALEIFIIYQNIPTANIVSFVDAIPKPHRAVESKGK
jgi:hypothetical protein